MKIDLNSYLEYGKVIKTSKRCDMVFSSTIFLFLFLPLVLVVYYNPIIRGRTFRNLVLLGASLLFYAWGEPKFVFLMLLSIVINYVIGVLLEFSKSNSMRRVWLIVSIVYNLGILFIFKYLGFALSNLALIFPHSISVNIVLPIGISFFTFQIMSYVFDVYKKEVPYQKNPLDLALYVSMFPQLIAGPIVRYGDIEYEIRNRIETKEDFYSGTTRFVLGLGKKVLLSNYLGVVADNVFMLAENEALSMGLAWIGIIAYALQIYYDFSGYSDMAIGMGKMFGFHFLENFNYPYISSSITEFWRRWHMSLGTWFRDYVYIPMGGNRVGSKRLILNIFTVWFLTGVWHGANWTFIAWGLLYFGLLLVEKLTGFTKKLPKWMCHLYTLFFVLIAWVLFRSNSMGDALTYVGYMFGMGGSLWDQRAMAYVLEAGILLVISMIAAMPVYAVIMKQLDKHSWLEYMYSAFVIAVFVFAVLVCVKATYNPFIYFNF